MKKLLLIALSLMVLFTGCTQEPKAANVEENGTKNESRVIQLGHVNPSNPDDQYQRLCQYFSDNLKELSNGKIEVNILSDSILGGERDMMEGMKNQTVDMAIITNLYYGNFVEDFRVFDLPFLFSNREEAYSVLDDPEIMDSMKQKLYDDFDVKFLAWGEGGFRQVLNTKNPINTPDDMKGLKIRVPESTMYIDTFKALGANPTTVAFSETYTAVQQKTVDGLELPLFSIYTGGYHDICKYISLTGHFYSPIALNMNKSLWESLTPEEQGWVQEAAIAAGKDQRIYVKDKEVELVGNMESAGAIVNEVSNKTLFREACQSIYENFRKTDKSGTLEKIEEKLSK